MPDIPKAQDQLFDARTSALDKYARLVVGRTGWLALIRHELVTMLSQSVPGALGLALRKVLYPLLLGACGRGVVFGQNVVLRHPGKIRIGDNVVIDDNCLLDAKGDSNAGITIGSGVVHRAQHDPVLQEWRYRCWATGRTSASTARCSRQAALRSAPTPCWRPTATSWAAITTSAIPSKAVLAQGRTSAGVEIGAGVWMGAGAKVLDGVSVGDHAIIGAQAVVKEPVPEFAIAVGIPAKVIGRRQGAPAEEGSARS